jgi:DNA-binding PadR family transcriptional regulator
MVRNTLPLSPKQRDLLPLTPAVFFILFALADGEKHGYAVMQQVGVLSDGKVNMGPGTLYTTIQRLLDFSLIEEIAHRNEPEGRRRYYRLTGAGKTLLQAEIGRMDAVVRLAHEKKLVPRNAE